MIAIVSRKRLVQREVLLDDLGTEEVCRRERLHRGVLRLGRAALHVAIDRLVATPPETIGVDPSGREPHVQAAQNGAGRAVVEALELDVTKGPIQALRQL